MNQGVHVRWVGGKRDFNGHLAKRLLVKTTTLVDYIYFPGGANGVRVSAVRRLRRVCEIAHNQSTLFHYKTASLRQVGNDESNSEKKSAKEALLLWCQRKTRGYPSVHITDFSTSWRNGMGFNALIHSHRPDLVRYEDLEPQNHIENLNQAFETAHRELGVPK